MSKPCLARLVSPAIVYELEELETSIGRNEDNDIVLRGSKSISGSHAKIVFHPKNKTRAKLLDLNSLNGVFRNGVKIIGGSEDLVSGDTIRFGYDPAEFTFYYEGDVVPQAAPKPRPDPEKIPTNPDPFVNKPKLASRTSAPTTPQPALKGTGAGFLAAKQRPSTAAPHRYAKRSQADSTEVGALLRQEPSPGLKAGKPSPKDAALRVSEDNPFKLPPPPSAAAPATGHVQPSTPVVSPAQPPTPVLPALPAISMPSSQPQHPWRKQGPPPSANWSDDESDVKSPTANPLEDVSVVPVHRKGVHQTEIPVIAPAQRSDGAMMSAEVVEELLPGQDLTSTLQAELDALKRKHEASEARLAKSRAHASMLRDSLTEQTAQSSTLSQQNAARMLSMWATTKQQQSLASAFATWRVGVSATSAKDARAKAATVAREAKEAKSELNATSAALQTVTAERDRLLRVIAEGADSVPSHISAEIQSLKAELSSANTQVSTLQQQRDTYIQQLSESAAALRDAESSASKAVNELVVSQRALDRTTERLETTNAQLQRQADELHVAKQAQALSVLNVWARGTVAKSVGAAFRHWASQVLKEKLAQDKSNKRDGDRIIAGLQHDVAQLQAEISSARSQSSQLREDVLKSRQDNDRLLADLAASRQANVDAISTKSELASTVAQLARSQQENATLRTQMTALERQRESLVGELRETSLALRTAEADRDATATHADRDAKHIASLREQVSRLQQAALTSSEASTAALKRSAARCIGQWCSGVSRKSLFNAFWSWKLATVSTACTQWKSRHYDAVKSLEGVQSSLNAAQNECAQVKHDRDALAKELADVQGTLSRVSIEAQNSKQDLTSQLSGSQREVTAAHDAVARLKDENTAMLLRCERMSTEAAALESQVTSLTSQLHETTSVLRQTESDCESAQARAVSAESALQRQLEKAGRSFDDAVQLKAKLLCAQQSLGCVKLVSLLEKRLKQRVLRCFKDWKTGNSPGVRGTVRIDDSTDPIPHPKAFLKQHPEVLAAVVDAALKQAEQSICAPLQQTIQHLQAVIEEKEDQLQRLLHAVGDVAGRQGDAKRQAAVGVLIAEIRRLQSG